MLTTSLKKILMLTFCNFQEETIFQQCLEFPH